LGHWAENKRGEVWTDSGVLYTLFRTNAAKQDKMHTIGPTQT